MAVEMRYAVVRDGKEHAVFATREEADAHDAMLERAEALFELLESCRETHGLDETQIDAVANLLAVKAEEMQAIFGKVKAGKRPAARAEKPKAEEEALEPPQEEEGPAASGERKLKVASGQN